MGASRGFIAKCCKWDEGLSYDELGCIIDEGQNLQVFDVAEMLMAYVCHCRSGLLLVWNADFGSKCLQWQANGPGPTLKSHIHQPQTGNELPQAADIDSI